MLGAEGGPLLAAFHIGLGMGALACVTASANAFASIGR